MTFLGAKEGLNIGSKFMLFFHHFLAVVFLNDFWDVASFLRDAWGHTVVFMKAMLQDFAENRLQSVPKMGPIWLLKFAWNLD